AHAMGIKSKLAPYLSTAIGASDVSLYEHVRGYQTFANQGQRIDLRVTNNVQDSRGHSVFKYENPTSTTVLTQSEAFLMTDVLKNYRTPGTSAGTVRWRARPGPATTAREASRTRGSWPTTRTSSSACGSATQRRTEVVD